VRLRIFLLLCFSLSGLVLSAEDWPEFRGPTGQGHSTEQGLPLEWSETKHVVWKTPVPGRGWSSPVVANGRVWLTTATDKPETSLRLLGFDSTSGKEIVNVEVFRVRPGPALNPKNSRASPTPIVEGDRVYVHFGQEGTAAVTTDGKIVWKAAIVYETQHGSGGSPVLYKDLLIFSGDGFDDAFVVALDKQTGKVRWRTPRRSPFSQSYTTPLVINTNGRDELISVGAYRVGAYDPATGKELWRVNYADGFSNVPRPVYGNGLLYITTGFNQPSLLAIRPGGSGDVTSTHVAWRLDRAVPFTPSPILVGDELYITSDLGIATCLDAKTGKPYWVARIEGNQSASPIYVDGRIYFLGEEGVATVIAPGRTFQVLARNTLDGDTLASIAVSGGAFYIRSMTHLYKISGTTGTTGTTGTR